jgi:L-2-hydroxyglutarate oxidase LhgO
MDRYSCDAVVIGAGVVGLAVARALALSGRETLILERNSHIGMETSSRNSEVIHAGMYYPTGSLKARHCVRGRELLYAYCAARGIASPRVGKLIVATAPEQDGKLASIKAQADKNGVGELRFLSRAEAERLEPAITFSAALFSPGTGILDSHQYMLALLGDATEKGASLVVGAVAQHIAVSADGRLALEVESAQERVRLETGIVVNAGGLWAGSIAQKIEGLAPAHVPRVTFAKGNYARLLSRSPFSHLVYPVPEPGGLGIHVTLDLGGQARFGPDVEWLDIADPERLDFAVAPAVCDRFAAAIGAYWSGARADLLAPDYSGVRPKLSGPGEPAADFVISGPAQHGIGGLVNLFGIESPGLTASLSLAEDVLAALQL